MRIILLLSVVFILSNCKSDKNTEETPHLFADYYVRYLETERQIKAHAAFYEGDPIPTARPIQFNSTVYFQGEPMNARRLPPNTIRYIYNGVGEYLPSGFTFQYQDPNNKTRKEVLKMSSIEDFSIRNEASISKGLTLDLQSTPFQENESLVLFFTNLGNNQAYSLEYKGLIDNPLFVEPTELEKLTPGKYILYLVKKQETILQKENTDVSTTVEFYSKTIEIQILK